VEFGDIKEREEIKESGQDEKDSRLPNKERIFNFRSKECCIKRIGKTIDNRTQDYTVQPNKKKYPFEQTNRTWI
jgi:hypothetical protein